MDPHRDQPDDAGTDQRRGSLTSLRPGSTGKSNRDRDGHVGSEGKREPANQPGNQPVRSSSRRARPDREDNGPEGHPNCAVPGQSRQANRRHDQEGRHDACADRCDTPPCPRQCVQPEDDQQVLQQPKRALCLQRVSEHPVPAGEHVERTRAVQVQEVDVGHLPLLNELGEDEHEALFQ